MSSDSSGLAPPSADLRQATAATPGVSWLEKAVLIYGPRKSGTTLLQNLLDSASELFVYPTEIKLKYFVKRKWGQADDADYYFSRSRIPTIESERLSLEDYRAKWRQHALRSDSPGLKALIQSDVLHALESVLPPAPRPEGWCAKEVGGATDRILALWFSLFAEPRVLLLLRDPLMSIRAILNDRRKQKHRLTIAQIVCETLDSLRVVRAQLRHLRDPRVHVVLYEDMVADTQDEMRRISEFLGISYSEHLTHPTILGERVVVATSSRPTTKVFAEQARWQDGLTLRERLTVGLTAALAALFPRYRVDYAALRRRLAAWGR
ncbi:MAG: sulfotransferase [Rhodovibrionaceae bacterium]